MDVREGGHLQCPRYRTCKQQVRSNYNNLYPQFLFLAVRDSMLPLDPLALMEVLEWPVGRRLGPRRSEKGRWALVGTGDVMDSLFVERQMH